MAETVRDFFLRITGKAMLPYQGRYGEEPFVSTLLEVATGLGKTYTVMVPWAYQVARGNRSTPTRLIIVLPRQNLTEQTYKTALEVITKAGLEGQVKVIQLMGKSKDNDLVLGPDERAVIVCTQDMYLSRALNRGYARRPARWPIDFALFNQDCLVVFDEVQLMSDGLATSTQLAAFRGQFKVFGEAICVWMSATLRPDWLDTVDFRGEHKNLRVIRLDEEDKVCEIVGKRLHAVKRISTAPESCRTPGNCAGFALSQHTAGTRTLIIANTVGRAREIYAGLKGHPGAVLLHSRFREGDRREKVDSLLGAIPSEGQIVVATQVLEAGIDLSAERAIIDAAPWGSMVQRFGRVNRYGESSEAQIWWVDQPLRSKVRADDPEKLFAPYVPEQVEAAIVKLRGLHSAAPADLPAEDGPAPWRHVLRRADLLDLFDTSSDLSGNEIDVSRFIRSGEDNDCYLAWRNWKNDVNEEKEVEDSELCPVPIGDLKDFAKKHALYAWNFVDGAWRRADPQRLYPGMILLTHSNEGGYTNDGGWNAESKQHVAPATIPKDVPDGAAADPLSWLTYRQTLRDHTDQVLEAMRGLLDQLSKLGAGEFRSQLETAAIKHDWGKAHKVMQRTLHNSEQWDELLAKQERSKSAGKHSRAHFRHELVSALAMLEAGDDDLAAYLAGSHHGKIRVCVRSMPGEIDERGTERVRGVEHGEVLASCELATGVTMPEVRMDLTYVRLGLGEEGKRSWTDRVVALRDQLGPFRLAYLEIMLRTADERASQTGGAACTK